MNPPLPKKCPEHSRHPPKLGECQEGGGGRVGKGEDRGYYQEEEKNSGKIKCVWGENNREIPTSVSNVRGILFLSLFLLSICDNN